MRPSFDAGRVAGVPVTSANDQVVLGPANVRIGGVGLAKGSSALRIWGDAPKKELVGSPGARVFYLRENSPGCTWFGRSACSSPAQSALGVILPPLPGPRR